MTKAQLNRETNRIPLMLANYSRFIWRHPYLAAAACIVVAIIISAGISRLTFNSSYKAYFRADNPQLLEFQAFQDTYSRTNHILVVVAPNDNNIFTAKNLDLVRRLTQKAWQVPYVARIDSLSNFQYTRARGDELIVSDLVPAEAPLNNRSLARIREYALNEPLLVNKIVSSTGHVTAVSIGLRLPRSYTNEILRPVHFVRQMIRDLQEENPGIQFYLTGGAVMDVAFPEASNNDLAHIVPQVFLIIVVMMIVLLRSILATIITFTVIVFASATGMGMAGWLGIPLTPTSVGAATIIATLAVADSVHLLTTLLQEMAGGKTKHQALETSLRLNIKPIFLTSLTTVIGFLSMNVSESPPFNDLGNITAIGITSAFIYSVALAPAMIAILPIKPSRAAVIKRHPMARLADWVLDHRRMLLWGIGLFSLVMAAFIPRTELDDQFVEYFDESVPFRQATDFTAANLTGIYALEFSVPAGSAGGIHEPDYLRALQKFERWLKDQAEVAHVHSIVPVLTRLNQNMHGDDPSWYRLPDSRQLAAQYLLLYELSLPYGLDLTDQINLDKSATRVSVLLKNLSTSELRQLEQRVNNWLARELPSYPAHATGPSIMFTRLSERNIRTMLISTSLAVVLISLTLIITLRDIRLGLLSLVPNVLPGIVAFGVWALLVGKVGLVISVISAMVLGIIVDDTVHFLSKYQALRHHLKLDRRQALRQTFTHVGTAIWITSMVLMSGFALLSFSSFSLSSDTGIMTTMAIGFALAADLLFLPPLLMAIEGKSKPSEDSGNRDATAEDTKLR